MGLMWGLFSVIIASAAQLSFGVCGESSTADDAILGFYCGIFAFGPGARMLVVGTVGYLLSVFAGIKRYTS